jgi:hypothetical protein
VLVGIGLGAAGLWAPTSSCAAESRGDIRETEGGLLLETAAPANMPEQTVFGIPYRSNQGRLVQIASTADPANESRGASTKPLSAPLALQTPAPAAGLTERIVPKTSEPAGGVTQLLDYVIALRSAPIELLIPGAVIVDGNRIPVGHAFAFTLPLSRFTGAVKTSTTNRAGAPEAKRTVANEDDTTMVLCSFQVVRVEHDGVLTVKVLPDQRFPPREAILTFVYSDSLSPSNDR